MVSPQAKREAVTVLMTERGFGVTRACGLLRISRSLYRYRSCRPACASLRSRIEEIAALKRRYGYRRIHILLRREGWRVNRKLTYRLYREAGLGELLTLGLRVESLTDEGVAQAQGYLLRQSRLTVPDSFALCLAQRNRWVLLSGDGALRALAEAEGVTCHGVLWLIDKIEAENAATTRQLRDGLQGLANHPRCRLPMDEVTTAYSERS